MPTTMPSEALLTMATFFDDCELLAYAFLVKQRRVHKTWLRPIYKWRTGLILDGEAELRRSERHSS